MMKVNDCGDPFFLFLKLSLLELLMSILSPISHSYFLILLPCHPSILSFVDLDTLFGPFAPLIPACQSDESLRGGRALTDHL